MLLYTKKANNVFDFVYEVFVDSGISLLRGSSPASWLLQGRVAVTSLVYAATS